MIFRRCRNVVYTLARATMKDPTRHRRASHGRRARCKPPVEAVVDGNRRLRNRCARRTARERRERRGERRVRWMRIVGINGARARRRVRRARDVGDGVRTRAMRGKDGKTDGASRRARVLSIGGLWMATGASAERGRMGTDADAVRRSARGRAARRWCGSAGAERESRSVW